MTPSYDTLKEILQEMWNGYVQVFSETHGYCGMVQS